MSPKPGKDAVTLYHIDGGSWSVYGEEHMEGDTLIRSLYRLLREKCELGPQGKDALSRKKWGDRNVERSEIYSDATMPACGVALVRTFDNEGNRVQYPQMPLTNSIPDVRMRHTDQALPSIDLRPSKNRRHSGSTYARNWVMDKVFTDKVSMDPVTGETATSAEVAVSRCGVTGLQTMAQILGRTKPNIALGPGNEEIMGVVFRSVPDDNGEFRQMLLDTHHSALAKDLEAAWRSATKGDAGNIAGQSGQSYAAEGSNVPAATLEGSEGTTYYEYMGYRVGEPEDISRLADAQENR